MPWGLSLTSQNQQELQLLFNRIAKQYLSICIVVFNIFLISACTEPNYQSENGADDKTDLLARNDESIQTEYIIVLVENVNITDSISILEKYDGQVIKDLKKGRYLIRLNNNPGIEQLQKEVEGSEHIEHIQPNFTYTTQ